MNIKDLLIPFALALFGTWVIQRLFITPVHDAGVRSGSGFVAPVTEQEVLPLNREVDFDDNEKQIEEGYEVVRTDYGVFTFSNYGAALDKAAYKKVDEDVASIDMILPDAELQKEDRCFLVALEEKTPYYYQLTNRLEQEDAVTITYKSDLADGGYIEKIFTINKRAPQIDLAVSIESSQENGQPIRPRIFYPAPRMEQPSKHEVISAIFNDEQGAIQKTAESSLDMQGGRFSPTLFGIDSAYFINSFISDENNDIKRGYYKVFGERQLEAVLEGASSSADKIGLHCSFYMGPKEYSLVQKVDARLEKTFNYSGILAPLSRLLVSLLRWINTYVKNYGLAIILLTILFRLLMFPFTMNTEENMKKKSEFSKKLKYLEQRYKHDPELLNRERAALLQQQGVPGGVAGCLPLLLQFPVFIALNRVLSGSFELYGAPFLWMSDLSAPDPYYVFPLFVGITFMLQALNKDPQQKMTFVALGLVIGAVTSNLSAGLALYIAVSTFMGLAQNALIRFFKKA